MPGWRPGAATLRDGALNQFKTAASWEVQDFVHPFCAVFRVFTYEGVEIFWKKNHGCVELAKLYHFTYFFFNEVFF